jgi:probable F420-dependent oxidoreductase
MKVDLMLMDADLDDMPALARGAEELGYARLLTTETKANPFLPLVLAAEHTERIELGTCIAMAFTRSPLHLAHLGHDLQRYSQGRFVLGLGSQVKAHVERRYSSIWSHPAERMRDVILAVRAIWRSWNEGTDLDYRGRFFRHSLMTPFFSPPPSVFGPPPILLAAVGERMTAVAGEVADGVMLHSLASTRYIRERALPALERGLRTAGRQRGHVEMYCPVLVITGDTEDEFQIARDAVRRQLAFYASTATYRSVLELHGFQNLQDELSALAKRGGWAEMGALINDDVLDAFSVTGPPEELSARIVERYGGLVDRVALYAPYSPAVSPWGRALDGFTVSDRR